MCRLCIVAKSSTFNCSFLDVFNLSSILRTEQASLPNAEAVTAPSSFHLPPSPPPVLAELCMEDSAAGGGRGIFHCQRERERERHKLCLHGRNRYTTSYCLAHTVPKNPMVTDISTGLILKQKLKKSFFVISLGVCKW